MRYRIGVLLITLSCIAAGLPRAHAQAADWTIISTPRVVEVGDHLAIAITTPAGATGEVLTQLRAGLQLLSATASSGSFAAGHWRLIGASQPATLLLLTVVDSRAQTNDDVTLAATWNGALRQTTTALSAPSPPITPDPPGCTFMPLVQYAAH